MNKSELLITLKNIKGIGNKFSLEICEKFNLDDQDTLSVFAAICQESTKHIMTLNGLIDANLKAKRTIEDCKANQIGIINYYDEDYPRKLYSLKNPPAILYYKGKISRLNERPTIAIIGTREPSNYGMEIAKRFAKYFAEHDFNIVSGLALGIDGISQESVIDSRGYTAAIIAQGLNTQIYPKENKDLAERILIEGGALITEYQNDEKANRYYFVERDRIQSGLSDGVLVIETDVEGGTMHAVKSILELKRKLGVLDHPEKYKKNNIKSNGNQMLINQGKADRLFSKESLDRFSVELINQFESQCGGIDLHQGELDDSNADTNQNDIINNIKTKNSTSKKVVSKDQLDFESDLFVSNKT